MTIGSHRLLGFAFASADLLIEISPSGVITYALGASEAVSGSHEDDLIGRPWRAMVEEADWPMLEALFDGLETGQRGGPILARLRADDGTPRAAVLSAFRVPENGDALSCAFSFAAPERAPPPGEMHDRQAFEDLTTALLQTAKATGADLELALVELAGLAAAREAAEGESRRKLEARLAGVLRAQAHGGQAATELGGERFALVRARGEGADTLVKRVGKLMDVDPERPIRPRADVIPLRSDPETEGGSRHTMKALRFSLDTFLRDGPGASGPSTLSEALSRAMQKTLDEVGALGAAIRDKQFRLVYQPVVRLADGALHHYETLVRFGDEESPFPLIRMAEEMELIEALDLAILERAVQTLAREGGIKLAVNVSGRTIASARFIEQASALIDAYPKSRGRLMFELTESAALDDLALADRHLQALRAKGCEICLDDFGAGAASLAYLQQLTLDVLKIDGRYIRDLQHGGREATFVKHLVQMCGELGVRTLAEMVETTAAEDAVRRAGVDFAQGWLYGAALDAPKPQLERAPFKARMRPALSR
ncbi:EAL domain-containing protein [Phenylobacterium deserti]|uniref:EAL domain-containing protein n=1 Tax=Phenylobacterium deserti TaxID=1914756 RepID=A0A328APK8_9CAUL|nr:EAL domain-containing protein [Phenylobacterium deserti]RAK56527.1 EAL domain-containing protein [Phenylobacterium deserti]